MNDHDDDEWLGGLRWRHFRSANVPALPHPRPRLAAIGRALARWWRRLQGHDPMRLK